MVTDRSRLDTYPYVVAQLCRLLSKLAAPAALLAGILAEKEEQGSGREAATEHPIDAGKAEAAGESCKVTATSLTR